MGFELTPELVAALYEAALDPDGLSALTQFIAQIMQVDSAGVWLIDNGEIKDLSVTADIEESQKPYIDYYHRFDVWQTGELLRHDKSGLEKVTLGTELISDRDLYKSEFYNDFARRFGMTNPLGAAVGLSATTAALVSTNRQSHQSRLTEDDKVPLETLLPHIKHALQLRMRLKLTAQIMPQFFALQTLAFGAIVCDQDSRIIFANSFAEHLMRARVAVGFRGKDRTLVAVLAHEAAKLSKLIHDAVIANIAGSVALADNNGRPRLIALVTPLPSSMTQAIGRGHALVALRARDAAPAFDAARLVSLFRLSPAQAALALALYESKSFEEIAIERGVKVSTLRTHFNELLNRTGAKGLRDLIRLLGVIPPLR